jgi:hypothetical protein
MVDEFGEANQEGELMKKKASFAVGLAVILGLLGALYGVYQLGRREERKITWFSEMTMKVYGRKVPYLSTQAIICPNGKVLGPVEIDLNLTNGKLRIIRNDPGLEPSCDMAPGVAPAAPPAAAPQKK